MDLILARVILFVFWLFVIGPLAFAFTQNSIIDQSTYRETCLYTFFLTAIAALLIGALASLNWAFRILFS